MSDTIFDNNFAVLGQRFKDVAQSLATTNADHLAVETQGCTLVVNEIQLTSSYDREKEATLQCGQVNENEEDVTLYGVGLADNIRLLLQRSRLRRLNVVILNKAVFLYVLHAIDHTHWLADDRVHLYLADTYEPNFRAYIALPGELTLAPPNARSLVDKVKTQLDEDFLNKQFQEQHSIRTESIKKNRSFVEQDKDVLNLSKISGDEVLVVGAGPSLDQQLSTLREATCPIIAVDASLKVLLENNIVPDYVVSIDYTAYRFFAQLDLSQLVDSTLLYFPHVQSEVLTAWPGQRVVSYSNTPMYQSLKKELPKTMLFSSGSVIHPAIDLAKMLGASNVILIGVDFAFSYNKSHAGEGNDSHRLPMSTAQDFVVNNQGNQVPTMTSFKRYLYDLSDYIKLNDQISFYNASAEGAMIEGTIMWSKAK